LKTELCDTPVKWDELYPHLAPGALCQRTEGFWQWAAFPFRQREECLVFVGYYASYSAPSISASKASPFSELKTCHTSTLSLDQLLQGKLQQQFRVVEQPLSLEALVQRQYLTLSHLKNPVVGSALTKFAAQAPGFSHGVSGIRLLSVIEDV